MRLSIVLAILFVYFSFSASAQIPENDWVFTEDIASVTDKVVGMIETSDGGFLFIGEHSEVDCGSGCSSWDDYKRSVYKLSRSGEVEWSTELVDLEGEPGGGRIIELSNNQGYILASNLGAVTKISASGVLGISVRHGFALQHLAYVDNKVLAKWDFESIIRIYDANLNLLTDVDVSSISITSMVPSLNPGKLIIFSGEDITEYNLSLQVQWTENFDNADIAGVLPYPSKIQNGGGKNDMDIVKASALTRTYNIRDYLLLGTKSGQGWVYADGKQRLYTNSLYSWTTTADRRIVLSRADSLVMLNGDLTTAWRTNQLTNTTIGISKDGSLYHYGGDNFRTTKTKPATYAAKELFSFTNTEYAWCGSPNPDCDGTNTGLDNATGQFLDYNNDGKLDYYHLGARWSVYQPADPPGSRRNSVLNAIVGQSGSQFTVSSKSAYSDAFLFLFNFHLADFDNDGQLESFNNTLNNINTATAALSNQTSGLPVLSTFDIPSSFADVDNNGLTDVFRNKDGIHRQTSANTYQKLNSAVLLDVENPIMIDINNDGTIDVIDRTARGIYLQQNLVFTKHATTLTHTPLFAVELNGDGHMDFIGKTGNNYFTCINNGSLAFTYTPLSIASPVFPVGDMNNDGKSDLAGGRHIYFNSGTGTFTKSQNGEYYLPAYDAVKSVIVGNIDDDGDLDLAVTDKFGVVIIQNNQATANQKPSAPSNLRAAKVGDVTTFQWDASTDDTTPAASLTYNVYIKKDGQTIVQSNSLASGKRTLVDAGNAGFRLAFSKASLPVGTYTWSVQAIDKGLEGSAFPQEHTFYITNNPTDISLSNLSIGENSANAIGTFTSTDVDNGETHSYTLVAGTGSTDNALFTITGNSLAAASATALNFETKASYSVRIRTTDSRQGFFEKVLTITVTDTQEGATDIFLSTASIPENSAVGTDIGTLTNNDPDAGDAHVYTLVAGAGDTDNASFSIAGNKLKSGQIFNFEVKNAYSIRVQTDDQHGQTFQKTLAITVADLNDLAKPVIAAPGQITQTQFVLTWATIEGASGYELDVSSNNFTGLLNGYNAKAVAATTTAVTGLAPGTIYQVRVRAVKGSDKSPNSDAVSQVTVPAAPVASEAIQVTSAGFTAVWVASTGATSYELEVSTGAEFVPIAGYNPKVVTGGLDAPVVELTALTVYEYRVRAVNSAGKSEVSNKRTVTTLQATLQVSSTAQANIPSGFGTTKIPGTVKGGQGTKTVVMKYRAILSKGAYLSKEALLKSGDDYEAEVPETAFDELGLEFYFEATNNGITARQPGSSYLYVSISASANKSIPFAIGFDGEPETYQMFSVPYNLADASILSVFAPAVGEYDKKVWRLYHYQGQKNEEYPKITKIELGKGYWFNARQETVQPKVGQATVEQATQSTSFKMSLVQGWNQIGNPYPFDLSWSAAVGSNDKVGDLNFYKSGAYSVSNVFKPWTGAFVFADEATDLFIPVSAKGSTRIQSDELTPTIDTDIWKVSLELSAGSLSIQSGIGMHPQANTSKDRFDQIALPRFIDYVELNTNHNEFFAPRFSLDVVPSTENYSWLFDVTSNRNGEKGELKWDHQSIAGAESTLILIDLKDQTWVDMKSTGSYSFTHKEGRQLRIAYSRKGEIKPGVTMLGYAYPNPFQADVTIPILLDEKATEVRVDVYNMLGQRLRTLSRRFSKGGIHMLPWDGKDDNGSDIPDGILLYRLSDGTSDVKRMIKQ